MDPTFFCQPNFFGPKMLFKKNVESNNISVEKLYYIKRFWVQKDFSFQQVLCTKIFWFQKDFGSKKILSPKGCWVQNYVGSKKILGLKYFRSTILGSKIFLVYKYLGPKIFLVYKYLGSKNIWYTNYYVGSIYIFNYDTLLGI